MQQFLLNVTFNPIQSKMAVTSQMRSVGLLQQSIPFLVAILYIMVHFSMFSLINFIAVSTEKSSSLHTIILKQNTNKATLCLVLQSSIFFSLLRLGTSFFLQSMLTLIVQTIVSECLVHSQSNS